MSDFDAVSSVDTEEEDELASSGMHVVGDADDQDDDLDDASAATAVIAPPEEEDEKDGLARLEELEKTLDEPPIEMGEEE